MGKDANSQRTAVTGLLAWETVKQSEREARRRARRKGERESEGGSDGGWTGAQRRDLPISGSAKTEGRWLAALRPFRRSRLAVIISISRFVRGIRIFMKQQTTMIMRRRIPKIIASSIHRRSPGAISWSSNHHLHVSPHIILTTSQPRSSRSRDPERPAWPELQLPPPSARLRLAPTAKTSLYPVSLCICTKAHCFPLPAPSFTKRRRARRSGLEVGGERAERRESGAKTRRKERGER